ncbi:MAG: cupredoxin domain-containing protein [Sporichthyaceae bacterium]
MGVRAQRYVGAVAAVAAGGAVVVGAALGASAGPAVADSAEKASATASAAKKPTAKKPTATLTIKDFDYRPATLVVAPGTKVKVVNRDRAAHTVTNKAKKIDSGDIAGKASKVLLAPKKRGTYSYICVYHPNMEAVLKVK